MHRHSLLPALSNDENATLSSACIARYALWQILQRTTLPNLPQRLTGSTPASHHNRLQIPSRISLAPCAVHLSLARSPSHLPSDHMLPHKTQAERSCSILHESFLPEYSSSPLASAAPLPVQRPHTFPANFLHKSHPRMYDLPWVRNARCRLHRPERPDADTA